MSHPGEGSSPASIPSWALQKAAEELYDTSDAEVIARRARELAGQSRELEEQSHNEFDDPDQGGEA